MGGRAGIEEPQASTFALPCHVIPSACFSTAGALTQAEQVLMLLDSQLQEL